MSGSVKLRAHDYNVTEIHNVGGGFLKVNLHEGMCCQKPSQLGKENFFF
jgi:hypothetical protein